MKKIFTLLTFIAVSTHTYSQQPAYALNRIIVKFKEENYKNIVFNNQNPLQSNYSILNQLNLKFSSSAFKKLSNIPNINIPHLIEFSKQQNIEQVINEYKATNLFEYAEPDYIGTGSGERLSPLITPNDTYFYNQWGLKNSGSLSFFSGAIVGADINASKAWDITTGSNQTIIAIIDSGLRLTHPELSGRIWTNPVEIQGNGIDDDGNGYIDDYSGGWDFVNNDNNSTDDHGHGTNVTSIIGMNSNNNNGLAGVNWQCKLMPLKALNSSNSGFYSWWISAMYYAVNKGAKAINMSVGGSSYSSGMQDAVNYAIANNTLIIASMMNNNNNTPFYPAALANILAVGSIDPDNKRTAPFFWGGGSSYGNHISVCAPGNYIYGLNAFNDTNFGSYWGGTSQAAPHVTGLVSLIQAMKPNRTPSEIRSIIERTAVDLIGRNTEDVAGFDQYHGWGRIDAWKALLENIKPTLTATLTTINSGQNTSLTASGCIGTVIWSTGQSGLTTITVTPNTSQAYTALCQNAGYNSPLSSINITVIGSQPCNSTHIVNSNISNNTTMTYPSSNYIEGSAVIGLNANVAFDAKRYILLVPGFSTQSPTNFIAKIGGCN